MSLDEPRRNADGDTIEDPKPPPVLKWYRSPLRPGYLEAFDPVLKGLRWIQIDWPEDLTPEMVKQWISNGKQGSLTREGPVGVPNRADNIGSTTQGNLGRDSAKRKFRSSSRSKSP